MPYAPFESKNFLNYFYLFSSALNSSKSTYLLLLIIYFFVFSNISSKLAFLTINAFEHSSIYVGNYIESFETPNLYNYLNTVDKLAIINISSLAKTVFKKSRYRILVC